MDIPIATTMIIIPRFFLSLFRYKTPRPSGIKIIIESAKKIPHKVWPIPHKSDRAIGTTGSLCGPKSAKTMPTNESNKIRHKTLYFIYIFILNILLNSFGFA